METIEFDTAYSAVSGEHIPGEYIPSVEHDDILDIVIDHVWHADSARFTGWRALTGYTQQHGYRGAVMHPSETADDDTIREWVREAGGDLFAIVEVSGHGEESPVFEGEPDYCEEYGCAHEPAGWAIIYRDAE